MTDPSPRAAILTKQLKSTLVEFERRARRNLASLPDPDPKLCAPGVQYASAFALPLDSDSTDLIVTSPPYASNAIDYMRAHKFSLVWFGHPLDDLSAARSRYIGGENTVKYAFEYLPESAERVVGEIGALDQKKGTVLRRYYSEMTLALREMYRVLRPGRAAVVVVGSSLMRGKDTLTGECLAEIGEAIGFNVPKIGTRKIDRNRRMLPAGMSVDVTQQIQNRMHEEYVIGLVKPA